MDIFITQNTYYFVHRYFIKFFENKKSEVIYVTEKRRGIKKKYFELVKTFGIARSLYFVLMELIFMIILFHRQIRLKTNTVTDHELNRFLENEIPKKKIRRIISIGCPCLIDSNLQSKYNIKIFNLHGGIIPYQKGRFSPIVALKNNHKFLGSSIHLINDTFDNGKIVSQDYFEVKNKDLIFNYNKVLFTSSLLLDDFLKGLCKSIPKEVINFL